MSMKCSDTNSVTICSAIFGENIQDNFFIFSKICTQECNFTTKKFCLIEPRRKLANEKGKK